jgi:apolipoprotein D and lipocalin family protein
MFKKNHKFFQTALFSVLMLPSLLACKSHPPLPVVADVDLERYQGRWYELASFPLRAQKHCTNTYAEYRLEGGEISVYNHCIDSTNHRVKDITGRAYPEKPGDNARLRVRFFKLFSAPYHIIALDSAYQYAMVGTPNRKYLWILHRQPVAPAGLIDALAAEAANLGFDTAQLNHTRHDPE